MRTNRRILLLSMAAVALLLPSCYDSKLPLSDPREEKSDDRLLGAWRFQGEGGEVNYYHFGRAGGKLPASILRVVNVRHTREGMVEQGELLIFPSSLDGKTYLNVAELKPSQLARLQEEGWKDGAVQAYLLLRYSVAADAMTLQWIDGDAKKRAVEAGKVKGTTEKDRDGNVRAIFTDSTANLAKFVGGAGDTLFSKDSLRLERVK